MSVIIKCDECGVEQEQVYEPNQLLGGANISFWSDCDDTIVDDADICQDCLVKVLIQGLPNIYNDIKVDKELTHLMKTTDDAEE